MKSLVEVSLVIDAIERLMIDAPDAYAKLQLWIEQVEAHGLDSAEAMGWFGAHLIGSKGTMAIKLTRSLWRAEYIASSDGSIVLITEVHAHEY